MRNLGLGVILLCSLFLAACSSDDDNGGGPGDPDTSSSFTISGDVEGEKTGVANVLFTEASGAFIMDIALSDAIGGDQTFSLSFFMGPSDEEIGIPEPGDYTIGGVNAADFWVVYVDIDGNESREYGSTWETSGILTITSSSSSVIEGEFEFDAEGDPDDFFEAQGAISVTNGEFRAEVY